MNRFWKRVARKRLDQSEKLIRNLNRLNEKEKIEQQEPKVLGQKLVKRKTNSEENTIQRG